MSKTVKLSTQINTNSGTVWNKVKTKELLFNVISPLGGFLITNDDGLETWKEGKTYKGWSFLLSVIPLGKRKIFIEKIDEKNKRIQSRERGEIGLKKWDHLIEVESISLNKTKYTDTVEIDAGILTIPYYLFAKVFYRFRQWKWRRMYK